VNDSGRPVDRSRPHYLWHRICFYSFFRFLSRVVTIVVFNLRVRGLTRLPKSHGAIVAPNHVSFLDPWLVGVVMPPIVSYMARESLFRIPIFGGFLRNLNSLPVVRGSNAARRGLKTGLDALKNNRTLVVFPEGTRSADGELQPLKRGIILLARQSGLPVVPIYCEGTFGAWPRQRRLPRLGPITIHIGEPISVDGSGSVRLEDSNDENRHPRVQDFGNSSENKDGKVGELQRLVDNGWAQAQAETRSWGHPTDASESSLGLEPEDSDVPVTFPDGAGDREPGSTEPLDQGAPRASREQKKTADKHSSAAFLESLVQSYRTLQGEVRKRRQVAPSGD
jgi:1-acyl-sn-glycerol-3-phosphate acyltransferase